MYFNENFNVFFKLIKVGLLVSEIYIYQLNDSYSKILRVVSQNTLIFIQTVARNSNLDSYS